MDLGEKVESDETGCVTGCDTGRVIAKFSHVAEADSFVEMVNDLPDKDDWANEAKFWTKLGS